MDKEKIKELLNGDISQLKELCNKYSIEEADKLIDNIISLKGQYEIKEVELIVEKEHTIKEYNFDSFKFIRNKKGILLHCKGGYDLFVKPTMQTLYGQLEMLLDYKDRYEELSDNEKEIYDALFSATFAICSLPCNAFLKDEFAFDIATRYLEFIQKETDTLLKTELQEETPDQDQVFADNIETFDKIEK